jgi:hypothetical protein
VEDAVDHRPVRGNHDRLTASVVQQAAGKYGIAPACKYVQRLNTQALFAARVPNFELGYDSVQRFDDVEGPNGGNQ